MSNELTTIAKRSSVIQQKQSLWEQEQKARFVELASDSTAKYSDVIEYAINEDKQNHKLLELITGLNVSVMMEYFNLIRLSKKYLEQ